MTGWDALVSTALLGTERRPPRPPDGNGVLGAIDWGDAEGALLSAASLVAAARAAGAEPAEVPAAEPAPQEAAPLCSPQADAVLARVLAEEPQLLAEWLGRAAGAGVLAWPRRLPELLAAGTYDRSLRGLVLRAGGRRAVWLAAQLRDWGWAAGDRENLSAWGTASRHERLALLDALRAEDPAAARALVESTWDEDAPDERRDFLDRLAGEGLSMADEPLLERALDDRRQPVRRAAARALDALPQSRRAQRMADRLAPLLSVAGTLRKRVEVEAPEALDAAMARDGIVEKPPRGTGPRAFWLHQIVAAAPLRVWTDTLGLPPARIVELVEAPLLDAIAKAAGHQRDPEWAEALVAHTGDAGHLLDLDAAASGPAIRAALKRARTLTEVERVIESATGPWDRETSAAMLDAFERGRPDRARWLRSRDLDGLAGGLDPALRERAAAVLARHEGEGIAPEAVADVLATLDLRHAIHREI